MNFICYDLEIVTAIPPKDGNLLPDIKYNQGWQDHANMGISVLCAYSSWDKRYRVFCGDNISELVNLVKQYEPLLVGFNNIAFDDAVIKATAGWGFTFPGVRRYDLLVETWLAAGLDPVYQHPTHDGYGLDAICQANFKEGKTGNGALAPVDWQRGNIGSVIDYCLADVRLTKMLFELPLNNLPVKSPKADEWLWLAAPENP
jgi:hypothetical protein